MTSGECNVSSDCLDGTGIVRVCYAEASFSNQTFFCDCSNWYGWKGDNCDEVSGQLIFFRIYLLIMALWGFLVALGSCRTIYYHIRAKLSQNKEFHPTFYSAILICLGCLFLGMNAVLELPAFFDPTWFTITTNGFYSETQEDIRVKSGKTIIFFQVIASFILFLAEVQIVGIWSTHIAMTSKWFPKMFSISETTLRDIAKVYIVSHAIILIIFMALDLFLVCSIIIGFSTLMTTIAYVVGYTRLRIALKLIRATKESVRALRIVVEVNTCCLVINSILLIAYYIAFIDYEAKLLIGGFNYVVFLRDLAVFNTLFLFSYNSFYLHKISTNILKLKAGSSCICCSAFFKKKSRSLTSFSQKKCTRDSTSFQMPTHATIASKDKVQELI